MHVRKCFSPILCFYAFWGAVLLQGCHIHVSEAYIDTGANTDWHSQGKGRFSILKGSDIKIYVRTSNKDPVFANKKYPNYFGISLWFDLEEKDFKFDPYEVLLMLSDSKVSKPVKINLEQAGFRPDDAGWECHGYPKMDFGPGPSYSLRRGFCVELYFDVNDPSPETAFSMRINGLIRGNKQVVVPEIRFRKGSFWQVG